MKLVHDSLMTYNIQLAMKHIYEDISAGSLLKRGLGTNIQNNNESLNSSIFTFIPKHSHCDKAFIKIATFIATCIFKDGFSTLLHSINTLIIQIGSNIYDLLLQSHWRPLACSEERMSDDANVDRIASRVKNILTDALFEEECFLYAPKSLINGKLKKFNDFQEKNISTLFFKNTIFLNFVRVFPKELN